MRNEEETRLLEIIMEKSFRRGSFRLASGATSDIYLDMKPTALDPEGASLIARAVLRRLESLPDVDGVGGLELGAVPIVTAVAQASWPERPISAFVVRKRTKDHGTEQPIDGNFKPGTVVAMIDDVTTKGGSVLQAIKAARASGAIVNTVISIVDRGEGATETLAAEGVVLLPVFTRADLGA